MKSAYDKYCDGDKFSNAELLKAIDEFQAAELALRPLGAAFSLALKECRRVLDALRGYADARGLTGAGA